MASVTATGSVAFLPRGARFAGVGLGAGVGVLSAEATGVVFLGAILDIGVYPVILYIIQFSLSAFRHVRIASGDRTKLTLCNLKSAYLSVYAMGIPAFKTMHPAKMRHRPFCKPFDIIVTYEMPTGYMRACDNKSGVPWYDCGVGEQLTSMCSKRFDALTLKDTETAQDDRLNAVVIGRRTWEAIGKVAFPGRVTIVISDRLQPYSNIGGTFVVVPSLDVALLLCGARDDIRNVFVAGGCETICVALKHRDLRHVHAIELYEGFGLGGIGYGGKQAFPFEDLYSIPRKFEVSRVLDIGGAFEKRFTKISRV